MKMNLFYKISPLSGS